MVGLSSSHLLVRSTLLQRALLRLTPPLHRATAAAARAENSLQQRHSLLVIDLSHVGYLKTGGYLREIEEQLRHSCVVELFCLFFWRAFVLPGKRKSEQS
ncbi:hypothetical protein CesoFtcFv8_024234 [Champsocephalus esox]|uniref:Uncharacterized protein n=1 Tax=Champsocephalus esox TaxID=159716 RepID=A0AAN8B684_9TELE|nr:hypothetical protein CesoFtcFv8_024234 [Champsocephalus esox]